ncbi:OmpA family protein [Flavobacterium capsici]|uniref:OmpA family protein n=1 Tax=Flavobacterium capsici TaxID=3075618 RepID=A0AA96F217_9FLAO|nr:MULTISPECIES: OmpA family protein [unclassified Flavobacterium]WNM18426.1 OmpA family protein [Flavobacterium sp. PMR2A8]WNM22477.1 OmpA family protein [Flavobacterium sp. PMTSA4]
MKIKNTLYSSLLLLVLSQQGYSQKSEVAAADKKYESSYYVDAIATYERLAEKGYKDENMFLKLGNANYFNAELPKAEKWYTELYKMNKEQEPEFYYRYAQSLKSIGNYSKANEMMELFNKKSGNDNRAKLYASHKNYLEEIKANSGKYAVEDAGINSANSDFGGVLTGNKVVFASSRPGNSGKVFEQTKESFTDLYESEVGTDGKLSEPKPFGGSTINTKFHESSVTFTKDGKTVYFTRNNFIDGKKGKITNNIMVLKVYKATYDDGAWGNVTELPFNSNEYNVANPALSPDDKTLYFVSDMPGTIGQSDLFKVEVKADGSFGNPVNLGKTINTEGRESFPFVSADNKLYFATDGRPGLGGYDVFASKVESDGSFKNVQNVGAPVNSPQDDFGFSIQSNGKGYVTSNRAGGKGSDDIYKVSEAQCKQKIEGIITDSESNEVLANVKVSLFNDKFELIKESKSDSKGSYSFEAECGKKYYIRTELENYITKESPVMVGNANGTTTLPITIEKAGCKLVVGGDLAKCFGIKVIYFDVNKSVITKEAVFELEKILDVMKQNSKLKIDVRSHTDSRQSAQYNQTLSDNRAKATIDWLVKNGVEASRLTGKGYGESQLLNKCADGVPCTEEEHQANRRSEFIVVAFE